MCRFHRFVHDFEQVPGERVEVDLAAQARAEMIDCARGIELAPVEATIHGFLDSPASR
jgi:hypothetical protein